MSDHIIIGICFKRGDDSQASVMVLITIKLSLLWQIIGVAVPFTHQDVIISYIFETKEKEKYMISGKDIFFCSVIM
jgi:hypothetical protein